MGFPGDSDSEQSACSAGGEDPLEKGMATHSSILAWRIPQTEDPGGPDIELCPGMQLNKLTQRPSSDAE